MPSLGLRWSFAVDGIAIPLILLTAALTLLVVLHSRGVEPPGGTPATFYGAILLTSFGALATFTVRDAIGFYIAFELVLVPMWVLIGRFGDEHAPAAVRTDAANRFLLFTVTGSAFLLVGLILLVTLTGTSNLDQLAAAAGSSLSHGQQVLLAVLLVAGMAIKVPLWPVHLAPAGALDRPHGRFGAAGRDPAEDGHLRPGPGRHPGGPGRLRDDRALSGRAGRHRHHLGRPGLPGRA